ncbi:histidinol-phosphate transaminase [Constantimarinum furrinae]|uniref:Histidinol-phosphate aminotransferase n=1 Tax=Constantimarinum furrinae TaxID=2562285 RepID=A0A7G8PWI2_9FLAO|nr:histidinol-phosphate transaminase [Constantimarinum furrinae]QNJ98698.1 Histidinol-phosphate aminotransferase [Constantimarinum furrinae]
MKDKNSILELVRPAIADLIPYRSAREEFSQTTREMVLLDANESPYSSEVNRYPDPQQRELKALISKLKGVNLNSILLGNGSDEVLDLIFRVFCEPGIDNVITLPPTYGMYNVLAGINNIENIEVPLTSKFEPDVDNILKSQNSQSKVLFLCSPNNPTGNRFQDKNIIRLLKQFRGIVVIDEAYIDFSEHDGFINQLSKFSNLIIVQTFSKAFGMAGIRLGMCFASEEIISTLNRVKPPYNVNELTQQYACKKLKGFEDINDRIDATRSERQQLCKALLNVSYVQKIYASDANFILMRVDDAEKRYLQLLDRGIVVRNRSQEVHCNNCLRITIGTAQENDKLLNELKAIDI